ncbi:MAG TPA: FtsX-like permease family protein, partial [Bacteroidales bacterium]|nr:FtsX-like permease family protein [Bacteroidales bacterium]
MITLKLAFRNLFGAGLRTWLNVFVLSFAFVIIVFTNGMLDGWNRQAYNDTKDWIAGNGQLWHATYDPYDPFCLQDAHAPITGKISELVRSRQITPLLITQASIFPGGGMQNILLRGIDTAQEIIHIPSASLKSSGEDIAAVIGKRMAASANLKKGDRVLMQWRDKNGTFDAKEIYVAEIFAANVPAIDKGQVWISLYELQKMTGLENQATLFIAGKQYPGGDVDNWKFRDVKFLMKDIDAVMAAKKSGTSMVYILLLALALLAIFDTQVLSVFRRQKEIGTYIALGMTRGRVVGIFTAEGTVISILAIIAGFIYGIPLLMLIQKTGIPMPGSVDDYGLAISDKIFPYYSIGLIMSTVLLVIISATIVSYFPAR